MASTAASRDYATEARAWRDHNPEAWEYITRRALALVSRGRHFSMKALIEAARWDAPLDLFAQGAYAINNSHTAYLARILVAELPQTEPYITMRRAVCGRQE